MTYRQTLAAVKQRLTDGGLKVIDALAKGSPTPHVQVMLVDFQAERTRMTGSTRTTNWDVVVRVKASSIDAQNTLLAEVDKVDAAFAAQLPNVVLSFPSSGTLEEADGLLSFHFILSITEEL